MLCRVSIILSWLLPIIVSFITVQNIALANEHFGSGSVEFKFVNEVSSDFEINYVSTTYSEQNSCVLDEVEIQANKDAHTIEDTSEGEGSYTLLKNNFVKMIYYVEKCEDKDQVSFKYKVSETKVSETKDSNNISIIAEVIFTMSFSAGGGDTPYFRENVSINCSGVSEYKCVTSDGYKAKIKPQ